MDETRPRTDRTPPGDGDPAGQGEARPGANGTPLGADETRPGPDRASRGRLGTPPGADETPPDTPDTPASAPAGPPPGVGEPLRPGDPEQLGGHRLLARLGSGGMGQVYLGRTPGGRLVAVKTVHAHLAGDAHFRARFRREAAAARAVTGAFTAAVVDADPDSALPWLATAYLPGVTLRRTVAVGGPLAPAAALALGGALAEALRDIHAAGLVHRDLKPSNVLVTGDGPRVIDFGIARVTDGTHPGLTGTGALIGTPGYMAPEQIAEGTPVTPATDVFALGAVLAYAASGRAPFGAGNAAVLLYRAVHDEPDLDGVPWAAGLRALVADCLRKEPARRPGPAEILRRTADRAAPLWWRTDPVRTLVGAPPQPPTGAPRTPGDKASGPADPRAQATVPTPDTSTGTPPDPAMNPDPRPAAATPAATSTRPNTDPRIRADTATRTTTAGGPPSGATPAVPRVPVPLPGERARRLRKLGRRGLLIAGAGGFAGLVAYAASLPTPDDGPSGPPEWEVRTGGAGPDAPRWTLSAGDGGAVDALLASGTGVVVHGTRDGYPAVGTVQAHDAAGGRRAWAAKASTSAPTAWGVVGGLLTAGDLGTRPLRLRDGRALPLDPRLPSGPLWFTVSGRTLVGLYEDTGDPAKYLLHAASLTTGERLWRRTESVRWERAVAFPGGVLLTDPAPGAVARYIGLDDGRNRWTYEEGGRSDGRPGWAVAGAVADDRPALLDAGGRLVLLDPARGKRVRERELGLTVSPGTTAFGRVGDAALLVSGGRLHGIDPATGALSWGRATLGLEPNWPRRAGGTRAPVGNGGALVHWSGGRTLECVDPGTGKPRWSARSVGDGPAACPPVLVGAVVYAVAGRICEAFRSSDGKPLGSWDTGGTVAELAADRHGWYVRLGRAEVKAYAPART
ncbi:protein kinase domain-containing protein [Streptomyces uncialis]|uniref:protein kinase domain-containing protein n=1 Tax=Streptomyces uncialis TaxID=1048205 RepID=UPI00386FE0CD|nr:PQQ-binding-like beta-propeller repeat protein [Streptomyces uncialis]